jgi:predicted amidophosphoribosyltransferase
LIKDVDTVDQATTTAIKDRKANVKSIFKISQKFLEKESSIGFSPGCWDVILVDDVCTTGSTLLSASAVLKSFGFRYVWCFTIAKTPKLEEYYFNI